MGNKPEWHELLVDEIRLEQEIRDLLLKKGYSDLETQKMMVEVSNQYGWFLSCEETAEAWDFEIGKLNVGMFYKKLAGLVIDEMDFEPPTGSEKKKPIKGKVKKMAKKDKVVSAAVHGLKVGTADEAGELLLDTAEVVLGTKVKDLLDTEEKRSLVKGLTAILLMHATELVTDDSETAEKVDAACALVIEAASRDLFQPKARELRKVASLLAEIGGKALLDKVK